MDGMTWRMKEWSRNTFSQEKQVVAEAEYIKSWLVDHGHNSDSHSGDLVQTWNNILCACAVQT